MYGRINIFILFWNLYRLSWNKFVKNSEAVSFTLMWPDSSWNKAKIVDRLDLYATGADVSSTRGAHLINDDLKRLEIII